MDNIDAPVQDSLSGGTANTVENAAHDSAPSPRVFRQEEVNDIVRRAKNDAVESFKRLSAQQPEYAAQKYGAIASTPGTTSGSWGEQDVRRLAAEEAQRLHESLLAEARTRSEQEAANRIVENYYAKVNANKNDYADFDTVTGDLEMGKFPNVVQILAENLDNSSDVLYELGKNRLKLAQLEALSERSLKDGIKEAKRLAQSLKEARSTTSKQPASPLSQQRPSNAAAESGPLSVSDYRRLYRV